MTVKKRQLAEINLIKYTWRQNFAEISFLKRCTQLKKASSLYKQKPNLVGDILRVDGRLTNTDLVFNLKQPIILPKSIHLFSVLIYEVH